MQSREPRSERFPLFAPASDAVCRRCQAQGRQVWETPYTWFLVAESLGCGHPWAAHAHTGCGQTQALGAAQSLPSLPTVQGPGAPSAAAGRSPWLSAQRPPGTPVSDPPAAYQSPGLSRMESHQGSPSAPPHRAPVLGCPQPPKLGGQGRVGSSQAAPAHSVAPPCAGDSGTGLWPHCTGDPRHHPRRNHTDGSQAGHGSGPSDQAGSGYSHVQSLDACRNRFHCWGHRR